MGNGYNLPQLVDDPTFQIPLTGWASKGSRPGRPNYGGSAEAQVSPYWAMGAALFSQLTSAYAGYQGVQMEVLEQKSQASAFAHRSRMLELDRAAAEKRAQSILEAGGEAVGDVTSAGAQQRAQTEANQAARGVESSTGGARDVLRSEKLLQDIDVYRISLETVQQANAARAGAVAIANEARFARVSSRNLRSSAKAAHGEAGLFAGLGAGLVNAAGIYDYRSRRR